MACLSPLTITNHGYHTAELKVRCGKCVRCKERTMNEWIFRLVQEDRRHLVADFLTLTYNTETVPITKNGFMTLFPRHFTLFMKRLRKNTGQRGIKYFACGEYGSKRKRPHYHAIIWSNIFGKESYENAWRNFNEDLNSKIPMGQVHVGSVSTGSIAYVCKYMDKPNQVGLHKRDDRIKEFRRMSQGLGENYLTPAVIKYHQKNLDKLYTVHKGYKVPLSKYYRDKIFTQEEKDKQLYYIVEAAQQKQIEDEIAAAKLGKSYVKYTEEVKASIKATYYKNKKSRE
jgi:hypothetical protein